MISPELLRRYPFFWCINDGQQKAIAMITEEVSLPKGTMVFREGAPADSLYLLMAGHVSLCLPGGGYQHTPGEALTVADINPGEPFGISAMVDEQAYNSCSQVTADCRALKIDALELRKLMAADCSMGFCLMQQLAKAALERLRLTHIQLAAAQ